MTAFLLQASQHTFHALNLRVSFTRTTFTKLGARNLRRILRERNVIVASPSDGALQAVPVAKNYRRL